ncbi:MAG: ATP-binding cassette domain-containing protein [Candidatus Sumerlaeaceae bacterium]|nr:ATP-binding cassette domain-containing protein [Candidatus Sumerlaeaceae bacterium]
MSKRFLISTGNVGRVSAFLWNRLAARSRQEELWALNDVSLSLRRGENLGMVGVNGSGKSTLLRLICGISQPSSGEIRSLPKIVALHDLSAGFHSALTGYENLFLSGSILGFSREELRAKLHEIVTFSGIDPKFLETPIRYYSTGMVMRLGFSLAVHTDPDVILIDEVIAVGDAEFQAKSARRLLQYRDSGKAMIAVSHNEYLLHQISDSMVWLHEGRIRSMGGVDDITREYRAFLQEQIEFSADRTSQASSSPDTGRAAVRFGGITLHDGSGTRPEKFQTNGVLCASLEMETLDPTDEMDLLVRVVASDKALVEEFLASERGVLFSPETRKLRLTLRFEPLILFRGTFQLQVLAVRRGQPRQILGVSQPAPFEVDMNFTPWPFYHAELPVRFEMD